MSIQHRPCRHADDAIRRFRRPLPLEPIEVLQVLYFDQTGHCVGHQVHSFGDADETWMSITGILSYAKHVHAVTLVLAHNHPNGIPYPSVEDQRSTHRLVDAAKNQNIHVLDHIILTHDSHRSMMTTPEGEQLRCWGQSLDWCSPPSCLQRDSHPESQCLHS